MMSRIIVKALRKRNETGLARIIHEGFYCNRRCLTQARRARRAGRGRVDLVHLVYLVCLVQPNKRDRPDKQERPADPRACRAPFRHFAKNRHEQSGLVSQSASETRGKGMCLRSFLPIDLYKSTRRERLNLYRSVLTPAHGPPGPCVMMRLSLMKILSQRGIPLLLG